MQKNAGRFFAGKLGRLGCLVDGRMRTHACASVIKGAIARRPGPKPANPGLYFKFIPKPQLRISSAPPCRASFPRSKRQA